MAKDGFLKALPLILLLAPACDRQEDRHVAAAPRTTPPASDGSAAGVVLPLLQPSADTDLAALEGSLLVEGRCLYIVGTAKTRSRTLAVFGMSGVRWDAAAARLRVRDSAFASGQRVVLGGGTPPNPSALAWVQPPDPSCDSSDLFVVGTIEAAPPAR